METLLPSSPPSSLPRHLPLTPSLSHHHKPHQLPLPKPTNSKSKSKSKTKTKTPEIKKEDDDTFSLLFTKNPHALHAQIKKLAANNDLPEALSLLDHLHRLRIPVNPTTFSSLLSSCARFKSPLHAQTLHSFIRSNSLSQNEFLRIKIIQMYASCGCFHDALLELSTLPSSDTVYAWNALLRGVVVSGNRSPEGVLGVYERMRGSGVEMNEYTFSCLIKGLAGSGGRGFKEGLKAHGLLVKNGLIGSSVLMTCLIDLYFKCRRPRLARQLFDEMPERDVVAWGAVVAGLAHSGLRREAVECLRRMVGEGVELNSVGLTTILPVVGKLGERNVGREIHGFVVKRGKYSEDLFIQSGLIGMYSKCGDLISARRTFNGSKRRNRVSWTALISGYIADGRLEQALRLVMWMQQEGLRPDVVTLATVLPVCAELKTGLRGRAIHGYLLRNGMSLNVSLSTSLMVMYSKCGGLEYCRRLFDRMERRNVVSWTVMIGSLAEHGCLEEAVDVFRSMLLQGQKPDAVVISKALGVCSELELLKLGKEIHGHVLKRKFERVPFVSAQVSNMYRKCKEIEKAELVLDQQQQQQKYIPLGAGSGEPGCMHPFPDQTQYIPLGNCAQS